MFKKIISIVLLCVILFIFPSCSDEIGTPTSSPDSSESSKYENKYKDIEYTKINSEGITWPKGQALPSFAPFAKNIDAIDVRSKGSATRSMVSTFAGIINRKQPRILLHTVEGEREKWPEIVGLNYTIEKDFSVIVAKYKSEIKGLIVWDTKMPDTIHLATALAGINDAMIVDEKQLETFSSAEFNFPIIEDLRGKFKDKLEVYNYMYDNVWKDCSHRLIIGIKTGGWELRDLAAGANVITLWLDPKDPQESKILDKFFSDCTQGESYYLGWWDSEGDGVTFSSQYGIPTIPADYYYNYSVYASTSRELDIPTVPAKPKLENKFYISFTVSDGDNLQYCQHSLKDVDRWDSDDRGLYPVNWTCAPALLDAGPQLLNHFYKTATENDLLIAGPSGMGYTYPTEWGSKAGGLDGLATYAMNTENYFNRTAFNIMTVWNFIGDDQSPVYAKNIRSLVGFSVQERLSGQKAQHDVDGIIPLITTKPRYDGDVPRIQQIIETDINAWDGNSPQFMMPQLIAWETNIHDINRIAKNLTKKYGDKVEFVRGDHLMMLWSESRGLPYNISLQSENITASGSDEDSDVSKIVDGSFSKNNGWKLSGEGEKWATIDLGSTYSISRYVVKNAATAYFDKSLNTKGFKIQASSNNEDWTDIDVVTSNTSDIVDKDVDVFTARYVRIYITNPGADNIARIQEFTVYGK